MTSNLAYKIIMYLSIITKLNLYKNTQENYTKDFQLPNYKIGH